MSGPRVSEEVYGLRQVHCTDEVSEKSTEETIVDIVAIHGKGANPARTWQSLRSLDLDRNKQENWIDWIQDKKMLPTVFVASRIFKYGYPSDWFGENALKTRAASIAEGLLDQLKDFRKENVNRPIIFIAHSFGGLVLLKV
ncbi:hypothetical protein MBLNU13_g09051t1 [Cladosporium sp. NU13]